MGELDRPSGPPAATAPGPTPWMRSRRPARPWTATSSPSQGPLGTGRRCRCGWPPPLGRPIRHRRPTPTPRAGRCCSRLPSAVGCGISPPSPGQHLRAAPAGERLGHRDIATAASLRALARRLQLLDAEVAAHPRAITVLVRAWHPELLAPTGVGPIVAAVVLCAWSHPGRCPSDAAFAMLGGAAPIPASSGQTVRVRLNRSGDRQLNQALHVVVLTRLRSDPATRADAQRRRAEGRARPTARSDAAWSAMSPASATDSSKPSPRFDPP